MEEKFVVGALVRAILGREKNETFIILKIDAKNHVLLVNGKQRKLENPKKKNIKHLESVETAVLKDIAVLIEKGVAVGNQRVYRSIHSKLQKKQED